MSLLFMDGVETYSTSTDIFKKWTDRSGFTFSSSIARTGTKSFSGTSGTITKQFINAAEQHETYIAGFGLQYTSSYSAITNSPIITFKSDINTTTHVTLCINSSGQLNARLGTHLGTLLGTATNTPLLLNNWYYVEFKVTLHDSTGTVDVKVNGDSVLSLSGIDTKNGGTMTQFDTVEFLGFGSLGRLYDDIYMCNGAGSTNNNFLGECRIRTLFPDANGTTSQLLGSDGNSTNNYLLVDDTTFTTTTYVGSGTDNQKDTYNFGSLSETTGNIKGIQTMAYAGKTDSAHRAGSIVTRTGGLEFDTPDITLSTSAIAYYDLREINPNTTIAWTISDVNNIELGFKIRP